MTSTWGSFLKHLARSAHLYFDQACEVARKYLFSVIFVSLVFAKLLHLYAHPYFLTLPGFLVWGSTFFLQEFILILIARGVLTRPYEWRIFRAVAILASVAFTLYVSFMATTDISFYIIMGREIHWGRAIGFFGDMIPTKTILMHVACCLILEAFTLVGSFFATPYLYEATGAFMNVWATALSPLVHRFYPRKKETLPDPAVYEQIALEDHDDDDKSDSESVTMLDPPKKSLEPKSTSPVKRIIVISISVLVFFLRCFRPSDRGYSILSDSPALAPFVGSHDLPVSKALTYLPGDFSWLENRTALDTPPEFPWLPHEPLNGFTAWYTNDEHYNPAKDPLHTPNLQNDILEPLREALQSGEVQVKHVLLLKLESQRQDIFPLRSNSHIMDKVRESYQNGHIPKDVEKRLANLTPFAQRMTGFETGFKDQDRPKPYGGFSAKNAFTSGTFTLKSLTGTFCGINALAVDMNHEFLYDKYQPCLPHIFEALNRQANMTTNTDDWKSWPWHTMWMQSVSDHYDNMYQLMPTLGFQDIISMEKIEEIGGANAPDESEKEPSRGYMDHVLKPYFRELVADAEKYKRRLFLGHLTGATHLPWNLPGHESEDLVDNTWFGLNDKLNRLLNSLVYQDEWLSYILETLEEAGVANETLIVMAGDHGVSLPNDGGVTPHDSPHVANNHVPLLFSHPKLPQVEIDNAVLSSQILPTILDLLIESSSLDDSSMEIIKDLLPMYEGQSMIRTLIPEQDRKQEWQFTTMNTGGSWLSLRSATKPYRLVFPLKRGAKWRFSDLETDPIELRPVVDFDLLSLVHVVRRRFGSEAAQWLTEAAYIADWWVSENYRRWGYDPKNPREP